MRASLSGWGDARDSSGDEKEMDSDVEASEENVEVFPGVLTNEE